MQFPVRESFHKTSVYVTKKDEQRQKQQQPESCYLALRRYTAHRLPAAQVISDGYCTDEF